LPTLAAQLPPPPAEGHASTSFSQLRKTDREVYRLLSNTHYPGLRHALRAIERTYAAGCDFGALLSTTGYPLFQAHLAEVRAADHFLTRSLNVGTIPRSSGRTADLRITTPDLAVTVEVFMRREWLGLDRWTDGMRDSLKNIDIAVDYVASVSTRSTSMRNWEPWELADALARPASSAVMEAVVTDFTAALERQEAPLHQTYDHVGLELATDLEIRSAHASVEMPSRLLFVSVPGFGGYSPAGVLRRIIDGPIRAKAGRRQSQSDSGVSCLLVDLTHAHIAGDLRTPAHFREAQQIVATVEPTDLDVELLALYRPYTGRLRGRCDYFAAFDDAAVSADDVLSLFGDTARL